MPARRVFQGRAELVGRVVATQAQGLLAVAIVEDDRWGEVGLVGQGEVPLGQVLGTNVPNAPGKVTARGRGAMERQLPTKIA